MWRLRYLTPGRVLLTPLRDLFGLIVWAAGMAGSTVEWRGIRFQIFSDGRIRQE
jgi:hypothetical protein